MSGNPLNHPHQMAAFALLLCSPSVLHGVCMTKDEGAIDNELKALGFSDAAKAVALEQWRQMYACIEPLGVVTPILRDALWAGQEPHPSPGDAPNIVRKMRELDNE